MTAEKYRIPRELRAKMSPMLAGVVEHTTVWTLFWVAVAAVLLYGPISGPHAPDHNALRYLLAPWVCPWGMTLWYWLVPFNPSGKGPVVQIAGRKDDDPPDADARRLAALFRAPAARRALLRITLKISLMLFAVMVLITVVVRQSLQWSLSSHWLLWGLMGAGIATSIAVGQEYFSWGIKRWVATADRGEKSL